MPTDVTRSLRRLWSTGTWKMPCIPVEGTFRFATRREGMSPTSEVRILTQKYHYLWFGSLPPIIDELPSGMGAIGNGEQTLRNAWSRRGEMKKASGDRPIMMVSFKAVREASHWGLWTMPRLCPMLSISDMSDTRDNRAAAA